MREDSLGIFCKQNKTFYYLETGDNYVGNTVDRIRKTLISRDLIHYNTRGLMSTDDFTVLTVRDAKVADHKLQPIYISKHVEQVLTSPAENSEEASTSSHWGASKTPKVKTKPKAKAKTRAKRTTKKKAEPTAQVETSNMAATTTESTSE